MSGERFDEWTRELGRRTLGRRPVPPPELPQISTVRGERFDRITRAISTVLTPLGGASSRLSVLKVLVRAIVDILVRPKFLAEVRFAWQVGKSAEMITFERMQYVRTRQTSDIQSVNINPREFLAKLHQDSRTEFLSVMTPAQQQQFLRAKTSRAFFNLLTPDQRAFLAVQYQPRFLGVGASVRYNPNFVPSGASLSAAPYPAIAAPPPRERIQRSPTLWSPQPTVLRNIGQIDKCLLKGGLDWHSCYYSYKATLKIDRDGAPCTYGPYPCGSGFPPNPPGKTFESPFCPGADADNYGCGALANQVLNVTDCPRQPNKKGVPLEHICNATNVNPPQVTCQYGSPAAGSQPIIGNAMYTSVVTDCSYPNLPNQPKRCIIDSYKDPVTGDLIKVPVKTDAKGCSPCIQQSDPGACGGIDCPCPGLYISQSAFRSPNWSAAPMNPDNYLNAVLIPFISVTRAAYINCGLSTGMFVVASTTYDAQSNPTEKPQDWVAGILADVGGTQFGEVSYAMAYALGMPADNVKVTFRIYPQVKVGWPVDRQQLESLKNKYLGVCCPGNIDDQCHAAEQRGTCITDLTDPNAGSCLCTNGWLPDTNGDCTWYCPGSDGSKWVGTSTDSGYEECDGNGRCMYQLPNQNSDTIGICTCDDGWWAGILGDSCTFRDCVKLEDWNNTNVQPCYGHGQCHHGVNTHNLGTCICDDGWTNGADGLQYCSEQTCHENCSGHGTCVQDVNGNPICACDVAHGWYGPDCSQQGCVTQDGRICSGNGSCQLDANGNPFCACPDEWGGGAQTGPTACGTRMCPECPAGVASCTNDWDWHEIFCLCICGNHCQHKWTCHCNDSNLKPPGCTTKKCCSGFWGECNTGLHGQGIGGGGVCQDNGVCQCYDGYDPSQCCAYPLPGVHAPQGFGQACYGASGKTIELNCSGQTSPCGACLAGQYANSWTLHPEGGGRFHDDVGNRYNLDESVCKVALTAYGPNTYGGLCGKAPDPAFWLSINGNAGNGVAGLLCSTDCSDCHATVPCTLTLH
jgi:hypothetical protein